MWMFIVSWMLLALVFIAFGKICESSILTTIGAVMVLLLATVETVS